MTVKLFIAATLDGYIATENDELDWLFSVKGDGDNGYGRFMADIDQIIMGKKTYDWLIQHENLDSDSENWPYTNQQSYIFTRSQLTDTLHAKFVHPSNLTEFVQNLSGNTWLVGGGEIIRLFLEADLIDEFFITVSPLLLGAGRSLFPNGSYFADLELLGTQTYGQFVELHYRKKAGRSHISL